MAPVFFEEEASASRSPAACRAAARRTASGNASKLPSAIRRSTSACLAAA